MLKFTCRPRRLSKGEEVCGSVTCGEQTARRLLLPLLVNSEVVSVQKNMHTRLARRREFHGHIHCLTPQEESNQVCIFARLEHFINVVYIGIGLILGGAGLNYGRICAVCLKNVVQMRPERTYPDAHSYK